MNKFDKMWKILKKECVKNKEKYKNELMDVIKEDGRLCGFVKKHGLCRMIVTDWESFCGDIDCHCCNTILDLWLDEEYKEPEVDWVKVPVDTLVRVRDSEDEEWTLQYFRCISDIIPNYKFEAWDDGRTSKTADGSIKPWKYCELVEEEE